jgi:hypothetical protein
MLAPFDNFEEYKAKAVITLKELLEKMEDTPGDVPIYGVLLCSYCGAANILKSSLDAPVNEYIAEGWLREYNVELRTILLICPECQKAHHTSAYDTAIASRQRDIEKYIKLKETLSLAGEKEVQSTSIVQHKEGYYTKELEKYYGKN